MSIPSETSPSPASQPDQTQSQPQTQVQSQAGPTPAPKRSSRRANTAERRATHNAVERARRETLNSRFLDLAAMLPNLAAVRRPSKSAIVNSSIALIHNQGRSRIIAARELRLLNAEANALRQELNEWRARNSLPRVEEPLRSGDFSTLLAVEDVEMGEEMILGRRSFDDMGEDDEYGDDGEEGEGLISPETAVPFAGLARAPIQYQQQQAIVAQHQQQQAQQQQQQQQQQLFEQQKAAMARAHQAQLAQAQSQAQARYTPPAQQHGSAMVHQTSHHHSQSHPVNMFNEAMFSADLYPTNNWSAKPPPTMITPPGSAHGVKQSPFATTANSAFLSGQQHNMGMFKPTYTSVSVNGSEDDGSDGSSHYSSVELNGTGMVDQTFSFGLSSNNVNQMNMGYQMMQVPSVNMYAMGMQMPPSPPHTGSPGHSNPQSRRPSVNVSIGSNKSSPSPAPMTANQYGMGLMI